MKVKINKDDLIGKQVGFLLVLKYWNCKHEQTKAGKKLRHFYLCKCLNCCNFKIVRRDQLKSNIIKTCGCSRRKRRWHK